MTHLPTGLTTTRDPLVMSSSQTARWTRRLPSTYTPPTDAEIAAMLAKGRPFDGDTVQATQPGAVEDEADDGYLRAIRLSPRLVGRSTGQVPVAVAWRLWEAGMIERAAG